VRPDGELLEQGTLNDARIAFQAPAGATLEVEQSERDTRRLPLAMANPVVREHIDYLADGGFLRDWPSCASGDVPVEAFRFDAVREALGEVRLAL
jgi:hypothetical protein